MNDHDRRPRRETNLPLSPLQSMLLSGGEAGQGSRRFVDASGLEDRRFLCVVPRLRYSPYPEIYGYEPSEQKLQRAEVNQEFKEADHAAVHELIVAWVRRTGWKVGW